jgi:hypothetical protein
MTMQFSGSNGLTFPDTSTQSSGKQVCKAWVNFNGVSGTTIRGSYNISSVTRVSTGRYDVNFTNSMPDANYSPVAFLNGNSGTGAGAFAAAGLWGINSLATGSVRVEYYNNDSGVYVDSALVFVAVFSA